MQALLVRGVGCYRCCRLTLLRLLVLQLAQRVGCYRCCRRMLLQLLALRLAQRAETPEATAATAA